MCLIVEAKISFERGREAQYFYETFSKLKHSEGGSNQSSKRQILAYAAVKVEIWLTSSTVAVFKSVLRKFVNPIDFHLHTKKWPRVSLFGQSGFLDNGGSNMSPQQQISITVKRSHA